VIGLRGQLVESGRIPETIGAALMGVFRQGNPSGVAREDRAAWMNGVPIKAAQEGGDGGRRGDVLLFVGCSPAYDPRVQVVPRALVRAFEAAGLDFCTLGTEENCCGNEVRRMGEMGLFEMLVEENGELIRATRAERLVAISPHCFNTLKNEYGLDGVEVLHYTQLISEFDEPRAILEAIPGVELVEMDRSRERSLCCEGGGGRMWAEGTNLEERLAFQRVREAFETGAEILAVACPFCLLTLEDAVKVQGLDNADAGGDRGGRSGRTLQVMDIMELVNLAL
jgi:Fe-S oxidoreductase